MNNFFCNWERNKIFNNYTHNIYESIDLLKEYLKAYPNDFISYLNLFKYYITIKDKENAEEVLSIIEENTYLYNDFLSHSSLKVGNMGISSFLNQKLRYLILNNNYEEAYKLCKENKYKIYECDNSVFLALFFLENKLGIPSKFKTNDGYTRTQIIDYSKERFINHANDHYDTSNGTNYFVFDFPLEKIIDRIQDTVPNNKSIYTDLISEKTFYKYDFCGMNSNKTIDYFTLVSLFGTNKLITMYPVEYGKNYDYIDINYLKNSINDKPKVKKRTQIDKFNQKYSIK